MKRSRKTKREEEAAVPEPQQPPAPDLHAIPFHQLVAALEAQNPQAPRVGAGSRPADEAIRFRASRSRSFEPAEIAEVKTPGDEERTELRVNFLGLYGPASPLPPEFTDRILESPLTLSAAEDFLDLFNHRLISLDYLVWRKKRHDLRYEPGACDPISKRVLALGGFPMEGPPPAALAPQHWLALAGVVALRSASAEVLATILSEAFDIPCRIEEFVRREVVMDEESQLRLGWSNNILGEDSVLGSRIEDDLGKFRICFGPASPDALETLMPGGEKHLAMVELATMGAGALDWDISFEFDAETLAETGLGLTRLGRSSRLGGKGGGGTGNPVILLHAAAGGTEPVPLAAGNFDSPESTGRGGSKAWR